jgi:oligopeptidase B
VAKIRSVSPSTSVLLRTEMGAGHGGPSGRYDAWKEEALVFAFLLDALGMHASDERPGSGLSSQS